MKTFIQLALILIVILFWSRTQAQLEVLDENTDLTRRSQHIAEDIQGDIITAQNSDVAKFNPATSSWLWTKYITVLGASGGAGLRRTDDLVVDNAGNIYFTGQYAGTVQFDNIILTSTTVKSGPNYISTADVFVAKVSSAGTFLWVKSFGSSLGGDAGFGIDVDGSGNVFITGGYANKSSANCGKSDIYVAKLNSTGSAIWQKRFAPGSCGYGQGNDVDVDLAGNVYITGSFNGTFQFGSGTGMIISSQGTSDVFTTKLNSTGTAQWVRSGTGPGISDKGSEIYVDNAGNVYAAGNYGYIYPNPGGSEIIFNSVTLQNTGGKEDFFVLKYSAAGNLQWAVNTGNVPLDGGVGSMVGLIPYGASSILVAGSPWGLKEISMMNGAFLNTYPVENNYEDIIPTINNTYYRLSFRDLGIAASGYIFSGYLVCGYVVINNLSLENESCPDCNVECTVPPYDEHPWHEFIVRTNAGAPLISPPQGGIGYAIVLPSFIEATGLEVYPNPATDEFTIYFDALQTEGSIQIFNQAGKVVFQKDISNESFSKKITIDQKLPDGLYYITLSAKDRSQTKSLIILDK